MVFLSLVKWNEPRVGATLQTDKKPWSCCANSQLPSVIVRAAKPRRVHKRPARFQLFFGVATHLPEQRGVGLPQVLREGVVLGQHFPELRDHGLRVQRLRLRDVLCGKQTLRLAQARCAFSACRSRLRQTAQCASTLRTAPVRKAASRRSATCCSSVTSRSSAAPLRVWARCSAVARFAACRL